MSHGGGVYVQWWWRLRPKGVAYTSKGAKVAYKSKGQISFLRNTHFSGLICTSLSCSRLKTDLRRFKCSDSVFAATSMSSTKQHTPGKLVIILSMVRCHNAGLEATTKGSLFTLNYPLLVLTVQSSLLASSNSSCWNAVLRSILENTVVRAQLGSINSSVGTGWCATSI